MTLYLTGSPTRFGEPAFTEDNGFLAEVKAALAEVTGGKPPRVLLVSAAPDDKGFTDSVKKGMSDCIHRSGIRTASVTMLERSNAGKSGELVKQADWIILCGGHVPTQNRFIHEIGLRELLKGYEGVVMGCSAGSMNCAEDVYSHPELPGEARDPGYKRWLKGLGLTDINLVPHFEQVRYAQVDGLRLFEDIAFPDSWGHRFYTFRDGGYIKVKDGRAILYGEAFEITRGAMHRISEENKTCCFMNVVFISPHFPQTYWHFCAGLKANGVNVLGIADTNYENLPWQLRECLSDYYKVHNLENYDEMYRAVAFYAHRYGKIDWIESNNEWWLEQDARLRTDFNVTTGIQNDHIAAIKNKSEMKKYYALGGIPTARQIKGAEGAAKIKAFVKKTGYPVIAKPDNGMGAGGTTKISNEADLKAWLEARSQDMGQYVIEEFITGLLVSYDAIYNSKGEPIFENNTVFPTPIMDIVHGNLDCCYWTNKTVPAKLAAIGRRTVKAFGIKSRFVHLEFFQLDRDREGLGKKGDYVGLEVNMRPPGGYTPDMMNYAHQTDVYQIWADMVAYDEARKPQGESAYVGYVGRRDVHQYKHSHQEVLDKYGPAVCMCERVPYALSDDLGDIAYIVRLSSKAEVDAFFKFVTE
ncbi:MAG: Type 1 glutamine amidotransferase-like domain-containing protein [Bacteroidales bacterium]|nr:Type 1 glutamine amidotransferase-like domain-containing protein [Bacteroidales bacterium]MBR0285961.1 Type 1 glutamine amidotransferase-like domain-containing protein [Bacteroidales bacterium]